VERLRRGMASAVIPVFTRVLREDPEAEVREAAAMALSEHREQEAVDALIAALTDPARCRRWHRCSRRMILVFVREWRRP